MFWICVTPNTTVEEAAIEVVYCIVGAEKDLKINYLYFQLNNILENIIVVFSVFTYNNRLLESSLDLIDVRPHYDCVEFPAVENVRDKQASN